MDLKFAANAAKAAGEILLAYRRRGVTVREKGRADLVSEADVESEKEIVRRIQLQYPNAAVLGEEDRKDAIPVTGDLWIVDPLDGTTNYLHGIPHYAVSIALYRDQKPLVGLVWNPEREDCYAAVSGQGAWHNGNRISVNKESALSESLIGVGFYYDRGVMMQATLDAVQACFEQQIHGIRRFGTAALDLAHVASGLYGGYFEYHLSPWDFAAGRLLVEEAGGIITTCTGGPLPIAPTTVLATNLQLHPPLLEITKRFAAKAVGKS